MHVKTCSRPSMPGINFDAPWDQRWCRASTLMPGINVDARHQRWSQGTSTLMRLDLASTLMPGINVRWCTLIRRWCALIWHQRWCRASTYVDAPWSGINVDAGHQRWSQGASTLMPGINVDPKVHQRWSQGASNLMPGIEGREHVFTCISSYSISLDRKSVV